MVQKFGPCLKNGVNVVFDKHLLFGKVNSEPNPSLVVYFYNKHRFYHKITF